MVRKTRIANFNESIPFKKRQKDPKRVLSLCPFYFTGRSCYTIEQPEMSSYFLTFPCFFKMLYVIFECFTPLSHLLETYPHDVRHSVYILVAPAGEANNDRLLLRQRRGKLHHMGYGMGRLKRRHDPLLPRQ